MKLIPLYLRPTIITFASILILLSNKGVEAQNTITSPKDFFGFQMGTDRKLTRWDKIVEYFYQLEQESDRLKVMNMGPSSEGHPFLLLLITSPDNLSDLDKLQMINKNEPFIALTILQGRIKILLA